MEYHIAIKKNEVDYCVQTFLCLRDISKILLIKGKKSSCKTLLYGIMPHMWEKDTYAYIQMLMYENG